MKNKTLVVHPICGDQRKKNLVILRIILDVEYTRIDFGYAAPWIYDRGGWIRIAPHTFIQEKGSNKRYALKEAQNIPLSPERLDFESVEDWTVFSLYFEPLPLQDCTIDIIEEETPDENDFNYYAIQLNDVHRLEVIA